MVSPLKYRFFEGRKTHLSLQSLEQCMEHSSSSIFAEWMKHNLEVLDFTKPNWGVF